MRRLIVAALLLIGLLVAGSPAALADPPGPTDFRSEVVGIAPAVPGVRISIVGGDSFVLLETDGVQVEVIGYSGEPYLRFGADGVVEENVLSPAKYLNEERYGGELPAEADPNAPPQWEVVATDGSYAWHDHRTHWMNPQPPPGLGPGDQVAEGVVPLRVDGAEVDVTVVSFWKEAPSRVPIWAGSAVGLGVAALVLTRSTSLSWVLLALGTAALVAGVTATVSVPRETGPPLSLWLLPAVGVFATAARLLAPQLGPWFTRQGDTLLLVASLALGAWGLAHWSWLWPAILPTSLPFWLDRLIGAGVLVGALGATGALVRSAVGAPRSV